MKIEGMGNERLAFPLLSVQAERICLVVKHAPFGHGKNTVVDEIIWKAWQINRSKVHCDDGENWDRILKGVVENLLDALGWTRLVGP